MVNPLELHLKASGPAGGRIAVQPGNQHTEPFQIGTLTLHSQSASQGHEGMVGQQIAEREPRIYKPLPDSSGKELTVTGAELVGIEKLAEGLSQFRQATQNGPPTIFGLCLGWSLIQGTPQTNARVDEFQQPGRRLSLAPRPRLIQPPGLLAPLVGLPPGLVHKPRSGARSTPGMR
jgi:hypothetical protein